MKGGCLGKGGVTTRLEMGRSWLGGWGVERVVIGLPEENLGGLAAWREVLSGSALLPARSEPNAQPRGMNSRKAATQRCEEERLRCRFGRGRYLTGHENDRQRIA